MGLLKSVKVTPYHAQIELSDAAATDFPTWQTGGEAVSATQHCVLVATREDRRGPVMIEVWQGAPPAGYLKGTAMPFDGAVDFSGEEVVVGSTVGGELHALSVTRGLHRLQVHTAPTGGRAAAVFFVIDP
jgi:hypothetical protein